MSRGTPQLVVAHHSAKFRCCGNISCLAHPAMPLPLSLSCMCLLRVCKNFSVLQGEILCGRAIQFFPPGTTCNAVCEINRWNRLFHIFLQHQLIGVAKTQGNSQGSAPVFSPTSLGFCSHPRPALNSTSCELPHVGV